MYSFIRLLSAGAVLSLAAGCVTSDKYDHAVGELDQTRGLLGSREQAMEEMSSENERLRREVHELRAENSMLSSSADQAKGRLDELRAQLADMENRLPGGVEMYAVDGGYAYNIKGEILFDSGKSDLKPSGRKVLNELAALLRETEQRIEIAGHTDTDPVQFTKDRYPEGNIQLGAWRAISVYNALAEAGIPNERMKVSSYGEWQPHPFKGEDKSQNRRVEIRLLTESPGN